MKEDCKYYDYGRHAPREYGVFCEIKKKTLKKEMCEGCKYYGKNHKERS